MPCVDHVVDDSKNNFCYTNGPARPVKYYNHTEDRRELEASVLSNEYYLSTFKDALRQVAIDVMTGESHSIPEQLIVPECSRCTNVKVLMLNEQTEPDTAAMAQHVKSLIDDCKKLLVDTEPVLGSWGLIDADPHTGDPHETEMDSVMVLTSDAYYVTDYDETSDRLLSVQRVPLADVTLLELGTLDTNPTVIEFIFAVFVVRCSVKPKIYHEST
ncbi:phosphatidylinositide phosphatase SAC2-like [Papilio machaon]|uniref:phosphatidylinositide phosphatase SAC2-like n=1 Tax=Papilio machaon TaxID=76193 RepID=UPI001E664517|nr:phosphatidylinositide phosphatase SAC2-like [Papilio machaon]